MRTFVMLALALAALAVQGCGTPCGSAQDTGVSGIVLHLPADSMVSAPETITVTSPMAITGTISANDAVSLNNGAGFTVSLTKDPGASDPTIATRTLSISWTFVNTDKNSPPSDQFDATVTDSAGNVSGQVSQMATETWISATTCQSGFWAGATASNQ
jgi:hypothetical protein